MLFRHRLNKIVFCRSDTEIQPFYKFFLKRIPSKPHHMCANRKQTNISFVVDTEKIDLKVN